MHRIAVGAWLTALIVTTSACAPDERADGAEGGAGQSRRAPFELRDTTDYTSMIGGGQRALLTRDGELLDTVDVAFGVHAIGRDTLLFLPVRTGYFEVDAKGDSTGYPEITEHVLWAAGTRRPLESRLPYFRSYFSSPAFADGAVHYWGMRPLSQETGAYLLYAARWRVAADAIDTLPLDSLTLQTDARGALPPPTVSGDGHVIYRTAGLAFRVAPDHRSAERLP